MWFDFFVFLLFVFQFWKNYNLPIDVYINLQSWYQCLNCFNCTSKSCKNLQSTPFCSIAPSVETKMHPRTWHMNFLGKTWRRCPHQNAVFWCVSFSANFWKILGSDGLAFLNQPIDPIWDFIGRTRGKRVWGLGDGKAESGEGFEAVDKTKEGSLHINKVEETKDRNGFYKIW